MDSPSVNFSYGDRSYCRSLDKIDTASLCSELRVDSSLRCEVSAIKSHDKGGCEISVSGIKISTRSDIIEAIHCYVNANWVALPIIALLDYISTMRRDYGYIISKKGYCGPTNNPYAANANTGALSRSCDLSVAVLFFGMGDEPSFGIYGKRLWFKFETIDEVPMTTDIVISAIDTQQLLPVVSILSQEGVYEVRFKEKLAFEYIMDKIMLSVNKYIAVARTSKSARNMVCIART